MILRSFPFKILLVFVGLAIIPIASVLVVGSRLATDALRKSAYQSLHAAALHTAFRLDTFILQHLDIVAREAQLPIFGDVLRLEGEARETHRVEVQRVLYSLMLTDRIFMTSATLFDAHGAVVATTGDSTAAEDPVMRAFLSEVIDIGIPAVSDVTQEQIYFGAPVLHHGAPLGMLRIGYNAHVLQQEIIQDSGSLGPESFPLLLNNRLACLANGAIPPGAQDPLRLPALSPSSSGAPHLEELGRRLAHIEEAGLGFSIQIPAISDKTLAASVAHMKTRPWRVAFFQPTDVFLAPVEERAQATLYWGAALVTVLLLLAMVIIRRLTRPILSLTEISRKLGQGVLGVRAHVTTSDEIGSLARAFNGMAEALQRRMEAQAFIAQVSQRFVGAESHQIDSILRDLVTEIARFFAVDRAVIVTFDSRDESAWGEIYEWPAAGLSAGQDDRPAPGPDTADLPWLRNELARSNIVHVASLSRAPWQAAGLRSLVATALSQGHIHIGYVCLAARQEELPWTGERTQVLYLLAELASHSLQRKWAESQIRALNEGLERRVKERTEELEATNHKLTDEIEERKRAQTERDQMHKQLYEVARRAGMAEVATTVLHNIGNAMNSVGVRSYMIQEHLAASEVRRLRDIADLLGQHTHDLPGFFASKKGALLPKYFDRLASCLAEEHEQVRTDMDSLRKAVEHVIQIVRAQQSYATSAETPEELSPIEVMEDAYSICSASIERNAIQIQRDYVDLPRIWLIRHRVVQILVNLINNAKDAVLADSVIKRRITMRVRITEHGHAQWQVIDTGVGVAREHLEEVFRYGFTTKADGHGFGLHGCMLSARDLGATLDFDSEGPGLGTTFSLTMPYQQPPTKASARRPSDLDLANESSQETKESGHS